MRTHQQMPAHELQLVRAPKALAALAHLAGLHPQELGGPVREPATLELAPEFDGLERRRGALAATVSAAISDWLWNPFAQAQRATLLDWSDALATFARQVLGWPAAQWWAHGYDPVAQVLLGSATSAPSTDLVDHVAEQAPPIILHQLSTSSTFVDEELPAAQLSDLDLTSRSTEPIACWRVRAQTGARVYEIQRLTDWLTLCDDYPRVHAVPDSWRRAGADGRFGISPEWQNVARDWDGVHFSMMGVLSASDVALTLGTYAVVPPSLNTEVTYWLRHAFRDPELLGTWHGELPD